MSVAAVSVSPDEVVDTLCAVLRNWGEVVMAGQLRLCPHPLDRRVYMVLAGQHIVYKVFVVD